MKNTSPKSNAATQKAPHKTSQRRRKVRQIPNAITQAIGDNLRRYRVKKEMTQLELAHSAECERTRVSKLELGYVNPSVLTLATMCHVLGITLADLFAGIRLSHPPTTEGGELRRANQAVLDKPQSKTKIKTKPKAAPASTRPRVSKS